MQRGVAALALTLVTTALTLAGAPQTRPAVPTAPVKRTFLRDIAPILDKKGCSVAACHGKFGGRGGLQLSLLTLTPADDYDPLVRGGRGRRVNLAEPEKSLLLLKATGKAPHGGGARFAVGSPEYTTLRDWIASGARFDPEADPHLVALTVTPGRAVLPKVGASVPLKVIATFSDGVRQNVTERANYEATDTAIVTVSERGVVTGRRWGGTAVVVRYLGTVQAATLTLPRAGQEPYPTLTASNRIDTLVQANLKRMNVHPSRLTTDPEFLRRVTIDLCGRLPEPEEVTAFLADKASDKRAKTIDRLLETDDFVALRTLRLADMLRIAPRHFGDGVFGERQTVLFTDWVQRAVAQNLPYDRFVRELLGARGSTFRNGAACFYRVDNTPEDRMETVTQAFLGQRMACARCHKHPFDRWNTDDYWNLAAFLGRVGLRGARLDGETDVYDEPNGRVINQSVTGKRRGKEAQPVLLGGTMPEVPREKTFDAFADWCVSPQNPFFARATVNRLWSHYLGRGLIHPVDDMRATTPESVPGLLDELAKDFTQNGYDIKRTVRLILNSRTYQTASDVNPTNVLDDKFFSHFYPRPMLGQVFLDALNQATGAKERFGDFPAETRAAHLELPVGSYFLDTFGRSHREFLANLEPKVEPTLVQTLHLLNAPYVEEKVRVGGGTVRRLIDDKTVTDDGIVGALYLKTFGRPPSAKEKAVALKMLTGAEKRDEAVQDLLWALITAREFYFVS
jgi:hypothetical protein